MEIINFASHFQEKKSNGLKNHSVIGAFYPNLRFVRHEQNRIDVILTLFVSYLNAYKAIKSRYPYSPLRITQTA